LDGEPEGLETKKRERESLETKDVERESLESKDGGRESWRARQECRVQSQITPPDFGLSRELWTGRRSATSRQWSGTQACHKHHGNQRDCSGGRSIDWKRYVKDKWANQEARTLDPELRDPTVHAQKGNDGSRRPYIRPQSAGSWISRSQGVNRQNESIKVNNQNSQIIYKGATASRVVGEAAPWEPTRSKIATSRRSGLRYQESPN